MLLKDFLNAVEDIGELFLDKSKNLNSQALVFQRTEDGCLERVQKIHVDHDGDVIIEWEKV